jgi:DNA polymerase-3 subunit beta
MKGVFLQENLIEGLRKVSHLASKGKTSLPILENILLKAEKGLLFFISTDLEIAIETSIRGRVESSGSFTVPADIFLSHLLYLPKESLNLEVKENELILKYKNGETKIKGLPAEDFPIIPRLEKKDGIKISGKELKESLRQVIVSCSSSEMRPEISGILFKIKEEKLFLVSTDSYRLTEKFIELKEGLKKEKRIIVPIKACQELLRILDDEDVEMFFSENQILFSQSQTNLISRIIQAEFPRYEEVIPKVFRTKILISKENLIKGIRSISPFSKTGINDISFEFFPEKGYLILSSLNPQIGETKMKIEGEITGEKNSLSFNYRYILDGLLIMPTDEVSLEIIDDSSPAVLKPFPESNLLYLLMPIKT